MLPSETRLRSQPHSKSAASLAQGHEPDEPAALFFAFARKLRAFVKEHGRVVVHFTVEHARVQGFALTVDVAVLELLRARVVRGAIDFTELRTWFAAHLVPIPRKPWPP